MQKADNLEAFVCVPRDNNCVLDKANKAALGNVGFGGVCARISCCLIKPDYAQAEKGTTTGAQGQKTSETKQWCF